MATYEYRGKTITAPLTIESNKPAETAETVSMKQQRVTSSGQRWELEFEVESMNGITDGTADVGDFLAQSVLGHTSDTGEEMIMPQITNNLGVTNDLTLSVETEKEVTEAAEIGSSFVKFGNLSFGNDIPKGLFVQMEGDDKIYLTTAKTIGSVQTLDSTTADATFTDFFANDTNLPAHTPTTDNPPRVGTSQLAAMRNWVSGTNYEIDDSARGSDGRHYLLSDDSNDGNNNPVFNNSFDGNGTEEWDLIFTKDISGTSIIDPSTVNIKDQPMAAAPRAYYREDTQGNFFVGDVVQDNRQVFKCLTDTTSKPSVTPANWELLADGKLPIAHETFSWVLAPYVVPFFDRDNDDNSLDAYDDTLSYTQGDEVTHLFAPWRANAAIAAGATNAPGLNAAWEILTGGFNSFYDDKQSYMSFMCRKANVNSTAFPAGVTKTLAKGLGQINAVTQTSSTNKFEEGQVFFGSGSGSGINNGYSAGIAKSYPFVCILAHETSERIDINQVLVDIQSWTYDADFVYLFGGNRFKCLVATAEGPDRRPELWTQLTSVLNEDFNDDYIVGSKGYYSEGFNTVDYNYQEIYGGTKSITKNKYFKAITFEPWCDTSPYEEWDIAMDDVDGNFYQVKKGATPRIGLRPGLDAGVAGVWTTSLKTALSSLNEFQPEDNILGPTIDITIGKATDTDSIPYYAAYISYQDGLYDFNSSLGTAGWRRDAPSAFAYSSVEWYTIPSTYTQDSQSVWEYTEYGRGANAASTAGARGGLINDPSSLAWESQIKSSYPTTLPDASEYSDLWRFRRAVSQVSGPTYTKPLNLNALPPTDRGGIQYELVINSGRTVSDPKFVFQLNSVDTSCIWAAPPVLFNTSTTMTKTEVIEKLMNESLSNVNYNYGSSNNASSTSTFGRILPWDNTAMPTRFQRVLYDNLIWKSTRLRSAGVVPGTNADYWDIETIQAPPWKSSVSYPYRSIVTYNGKQYTTSFNINAPTPTLGITPVLDPNWYINRNPETLLTYTSSVDYGINQRVNSGTNRSLVYRAIRATKGNYPPTSPLDFELEVRDPWVLGTTYSAEDLVTFADTGQVGSVYRAIRSTTGDQPDESPLDWANETLIPNDFSINFHSFADIENDRIIITLQDPAKRENGNAAANTLLYPLSLATASSLFTLRPLTTATSSNDDDLYWNQQWKIGATTVGGTPGYVKKGLVTRQFEESRTDPRFNGTGPGEVNGEITIYPPLVKAKATTSKIKNSDETTLKYFVNTSNIVGIRYVDGVLASAGRTKIYEKLI